MNISNSLLVVACMCVPVCTNATLIKSDKIIIDSVSGLQWYDLAASSTYTVTEFQGLNPTFHLAEATQVYGLFNDYFHPFSGFNTESLNFDQAVRQLYT